MQIFHLHIANTFRLPAPSLRGKSDVDNIGVCVRAGGEAVVVLVLFLLLFPLFSFAQTRVISGTVSDDMGPIMMANVVERRTRRISSKSLTSVARNIV